MRFRDVLGNICNKSRNFFKKSAKKFVELKIMRTFATRLRKNGNDKFIEKTGNCTSKYREKIQFIEKR